MAESPGPVIADDAEDQIRGPTKRGIVLDLMRSLGFAVERLSVPGKCSSVLTAPAARTLREPGDDMTCKRPALYLVRSEPFCRSHAASEIFSFLTGDEGVR